MTWERAKKPASYACGGLSLALCATYFLGIATLPSGPRGDNLTTTILLSCLAVGALLGAASLKLMPERKRGFRRTVAKGTAVVHPRVHPEKAAFYFRMEVMSLLELNFGDFPRVEAALRAEIDAATGKHPELYTVGELQRFVVKHVAGKTEPQAKLRRAFYRVRGALRETLPIAARKIRPSARLESLFPHENRVVLWRAFHQRLGAAAPPLELPYGYKWLAVLAMLPFLCIASVGLERGPVLLGLAGLAGFVALFFLFGRAMTAAGFATRIPEYPSTVRQLVNSLAHRELATPVVLDEAVLRDRIQKAFSEAAGVPREQIRPEVRLGDLGKVLADVEEK